MSAPRRPAGGPGSSVASRPDGLPPKPPDEEKAHAAEAARILRKIESDARAIERRSHARDDRNAAAAQFWRGELSALGIPVSVEDDVLRDDLVPNNSQDADDMELEEARSMCQKFRLHLGRVSSSESASDSGRSAATLSALTKQLFSINARRKEAKVRVKQWRAGLPPSLRGRLWTICLPNQTNITRALFSVFLRHAAERKKQMQMSARALNDEYLNLKRQDEEHAALGGVAVSTPEIIDGGLQRQGEHGSALDDVAAVSATTSEDVASSLDRQDGRQDGENVTSKDGSVNEVDGVNLPVATQNDPTRRQVLLLGRESSVNLIDLDVPRTFPVLSFFNDGSPLYASLKSVLEAYTCYRPDIGYVQGMSFLAATLLLNVGEFEAFVLLCNILNGRMLQVFYRMHLPSMERYFRVFEQVLGRVAPSVLENLHACHITPHHYLIDWVLTLFSRALSLDVAARVWDWYVLDGEAALLRVGLGLICYLRPRLSAPAQVEDCLSLLTRLDEIDIDCDLLFVHVKKVKFVEADLDRLLQEDRAAPLTPS